MSELEDRINSVLSDPQELERITKLARSFMGGPDSPEGTETLRSGPALNIPEGLLGGLDMEALSRAGKLLSGAGGMDSREKALLEAMKPYLSEKRRGKMDRAMKLAKLAKLAGFAMGEMEREDDA